MGSRKHNHNGWKNLCWKASLCSLLAFPHAVFSLQEEISEAETFEEELEDAYLTEFDDEDEKNPLLTELDEDSPLSDNDSTLTEEETLPIEMDDVPALSDAAPFPIELDQPIAEDSSSSTIDTIPLPPYLSVQTPPMQEKLPQPNRVVRNSQLQIGGNYTYVTLQPNGHNTFTGNLGGMQAIYEYMPKNFFYGAAQFEWRQGNTHSHAGKRWLLNFDAQERVGYTFASRTDCWRVALFTGFGYHYLRHNFHPKKGDSLKFTYNEFYVPVGALSNYTVSSLFSIGADLIWMPQVFPTVSIVPLKGANWSLSYRLWNFNVAIPCTFTFTQSKKFQLIIKPFYTHWEDGHSTAKLSNGTRLGLPANIYNFYGVDVNFGYRF